MQSLLTMGYQTVLRCDRMNPFDHVRVFHLLVDIHMAVIQNLDPSPRSCPTRHAVFTSIMSTICMISHILQHVRQLQTHLSMDRYGIFHTFLAATCMHVILYLLLKCLIVMIQETVLDLVLSSAVAQVGSETFGDVCPYPGPFHAADSQH